MIRDSYTNRFQRKAKRLTMRTLGKDLTNGGERVDIDYRKSIDFESLDIYQKSHFRRYEFVSSLLSPDMLVGDFACGTGYGTVMMAQVVQKAYGCDIDAATIAAIKERYRGYGSVAFLYGDLLEIRGLPLLGFVVSFETVEYCVENTICSLFEKLRSLLRPDGAFVFSVPFMQPDTPASRRHHRTSGIDETKVREWTDQAGFRVQSIYFQNYESHDIADQLLHKDFMICVCTKKSPSHTVRMRD